MGLTHNERKEHDTMSDIQLTGLPGAPTTPQAEPAPSAKFVVSREVGVGDATDVTVLYAGDAVEEAQRAYADAVPGDGCVQLLEDGEVIDAKRAPKPVLVDAPAPTRDDELFDGGTFQSAKPQVDGEDADKIRVVFSGTWELDPMLEDEVAFWNRLAMGQSLDLQVQAEVTGIGGKYKRSEDDTETITGVATAKIAHVHRLSPEEL